MSKSAVAEGCASFFADKDCSKGDRKGPLPALHHSRPYNVATKCFYIIPRFITLAQNILVADHKEPHASAILDYAQLALQAE